MAPATRQPRPARPAGPDAGYFERLRTPWWWYLAAVGVALLLGLEFAVAFSSWLAWLPLALLVLGGLLVVRQLSSGSVSVHAGALQAGDRTVPVADIAQAIDLSPTELRRLVGRHSDPLAFTYIRSWVGPGVQLVLRPPADPPTERLPEPYWVVSTRRPDQLLAALAAARS